MPRFEFYFPDSLHTGIVVARSPAKAAVKAVRGKHKRDLMHPESTVVMVRCKVPSAFKAININADPAGNPAGDYERYAVTIRAEPVYTAKREAGRR